MSDFAKRAGATTLDLFGNVITGALKGVEGIYDMGAGLVGAVGGIFDKDFQKDVKAHIEKDHVGTFMNDVVNLDDMTRGSYLDDSAAGRMVEGVASGLGQMLPAVAVSWIPGVGPALGLAVTGVSAAGNATEEAFNDGADYTRGMLYGAASGTVEAGTEKLFGGFTKGITGAGLLDDVGKSIAGEIGEVGLRRVAKDAIGEGVEEIAAEIANPALKSIYKGKGAFSEYGDAEYWKGVGEAGIVGAGTALAYGGTVGRALKSSGKYADVASSIESVQNITKKLADIDAAGKLDADIDSVAANTILTNYEQVETTLKSVSEKQRADIIKRNNLSAIFEADGSLKESVGAALDRRIDKSGGFRGEYYTVNARGKESVIAEDLEKISAKLNVKEGIKASREGAEAPTSSVRVFSGELTDTGRENLTKTKKALRALNERAGSDVSLIVTEDISGTNGIMVGDRMYITREALENGKYARTLVHEYTHFAEGTREYNDLVSFLSKDSEAFVAAAENVLANNYGITREQIDAISEKIGRGEALTDSENRIRALMLSETNAKMTEAILGNEQFINKLVREDASLAGKIIDKIKSLVEMLKNIGDSAAMAEHRRLVEAEKLYLKAAEAAGNRALVEKIRGGDDKEDNESQFSFAGEQAESADILKLDTAKAMIESGIDSETVRKETGWFKGYDGKWRFEIDDSDIEISFNGKLSRNPEIRRYAELLEKAYLLDTATEEEIKELAELDKKFKEKNITPNKLGDMIKHPKLFAAYPELADVEIYFNESPDTASYHPGFKEISIPKKLRMDSRRFRKTLMHEIQHAVQDIEGFAGGSNVDIFNNTNERTAREQYESTAGEIEARDVANRADMSADERKNTRPDIDREDVVFARDNGVSLDFDEKVNTSDEKIQFSHSDNDIDPERITVGMSEDERAKILKHLKLRPQKIIIPQKFDIDFEQLEKSRKSEISNTLIQKLRDLGCLKAYQTSSVDVQFEFTGGGLRKSMNSQVYDYGGTLGDLAKVVLNMQTLLDSAVLLEIHSDKAVGTEQENKQLKNTYVLLSAFVEGENITPVQFEIKQYVDENNRLYLAVALTKIETSVVGDTISDKNQTSTRLLPVSAISIPRLIEKINPSDKNFFKYIPDSFLNDEQLAAKKRALNEENKKYGRSEIQFSHSDNDIDPANARKKNPSIADIERRKAEFEKLRVYEKADAEIIINNILSSVLPADEDVFSQLENKTRKQAENILYDALNRASTDAEKTKAASDLADYIIMHSVVKDYVNEQEKSAMREDYQTVIAYLSGLRNALNLDGIKDEIKHRFDDKAGGVYLQWAAKAGTRGRFTVDSIIEDINSVLSGLPGFPIEAVNEAEIFFGLYDAYQNAKEGLKKESTAYLDEYITPDERKKLKRDIVNSILEARKTLGRESALSKVMREYNRRMREANGEVERMKQINKLIFQVDELKNMSIGRFVNANTYRTDLFDSAIAELKKITRGGNISVAGIRTAASHLVQWYNKSNPLIGEGGFDSAVFDALSRIADNNLTDEKGNVIKIQEILEQYKKNLDLSNVLDKKGRKIPKNSIWRATEENKNPITLKEVAKQLRAKGIVIEGDDSAIFDYIQTAYKDPSRPLTTEDFRDLTDVVAYFRKYITNFKKVYRNGKYEEALPIARNYVDIMEKNESVRVGWLTKLGKGGYAQHFFRPQTIAKIMDGYEKGFYTDMLAEFRRGSIQAADYEYEMQRDIEPFYKKNKKYFKSLPDRTVKYDGKEIPVNIAMSLYMTSKREQARAGLGASGFQFELNGDKVAKFSGCNNTGTIEGLINGVSEMQKALYDQFSDTDKAFIELAEKIFNTRCKELKYKTDIETKGYSNTVDGYYYPIRRAFVAKSIDSDFEDLMGRASNKSFNKDTVKGAKGVLCIMPLTDMLSRHVKGVAQYAALANVVRNYDTLYNLSLNENANDPVSVHSVGQKTWIGGEDYMKQLLSDVQGIGQKKSPVLSGIMGGYATYQLGANPKTWLSQMSSLFAATSVLDFDCVMRGITVKSSDVDKYSSIAKIRNANNDAVLAQANANKRSLLGKENKVTGSLKDFGELLMKPISVMDRFVVKRLFGACQLQVAKNGGAKVGTEANKKAAAELLETVIISTQQNAYATERSAAMRGGEISRMITMFSADGMNVIGQAIDGFGEYCTLKRQIRLETDTKRRAELQERLKLAGKKTRKSFFALFSSAAFMGAIAILFHKFYGRELEDDETYLDFFAANSIGNIFGGLPLMRDAYTYFVDGYEVEGYLFSTLNETFAGMKEVAELSTQLVSGKPVNQRDIANGVRKVLYSSGQIVGVPVRNIYNSTRGVLGLLNGSAAYTVDDLFYKQSYNKDLAKAIEKGDDDLVSTILGIVTGERIGAIEDDKSRETLNRLTVKGYDVLPRAVGDTMSYNGTEYELSAKEQSKFKSIYAEAHPALAELVKLPAFTKADEETQADAVKRLYNVYYEIARNEVLNIPETKTTLFARVLDIEELALVIAHASNLKADKDKAGNSISGSKKAKVQKYIESLNLTAAEKYLIMGYLGYKNLYGKEKVTAYLTKYKLSYNEKTQIFKACGY